MAYRDTPQWPDYRRFRNVEKDDSIISLVSLGFTKWTRCRRIILGATGIFLSGRLFAQA